MRRSKFTLIVPASDGSKDVCLYHTLNDHLIRVSQSEDESIYKIFNKIKNHDESFTERERQSLAVLAELGFVVSDEIDEHNLFKQWYQKILKESSRSMVATVVTTMSCNLRCPYCFEQDQLSSSKFMTIAVAKQLSLWLQRKMYERKIQRMNVVFFGGEPLLNCQVIEEIGISLSSICKNDGISWKAGIITNGTLLTGEIAEILSNSGVSWAKVTLDGDRECHDKLRPYANGKGSFDRIFDNLDAASKYLKLIIGGNIDETNIDSVPSLLDRIAAAPWRDKILSIRFKPIQKTKNTICGNPKAACQLSAFTKEQVAWMLQLREETIKRNLPVNSNPNVGPCDFYSPNAISIGIDGALYPCGAFVGVPEFAMGNIASDDLTDFGKEVEKLRAWDEECSNCPFLPVCAGGCRAAAYYAKHDLSAKVCDRTFYHLMLPRYVNSFIDSSANEGERDSIFD